jgi:hypothetical protein
MVSKLIGKIMKHVITFISVVLTVGYMYSQESGFPYPLMAVRSIANAQNEIEPQQSLLNQSKTDKKSVSKAFFYSLIVPGLGEAYVGRTGYIKFFLSVEAVAWGLLFANHQNVKWQTNDYQNYAVQHAGINRKGKDADYWINVGFYNTIYDYNEQMRRDRNVDAIYDENTFYAWYWDSDANRKYYAVKRAETREMEGRAIYFMGALVLNHLVSAINAMRVARQYNKKQELSWNLDCGYDPLTSRLLLSYSKNF